MRLLIFTQKVDKDDVVLGFFHSWLQEFAKQCESVKVICLYKGKSELPENVEVFSLGKEMGLGRIGYLKNLFKHMGSIVGLYDRVFVHMNPEYLVLCGWYFKLKSIPAYLWYVHREADLKLKIAALFVRKIFTSTKESLNLPTNKAVFLGHGIDVERLPNTSHLYTGEVLRIAHIGRITRIKNIEVLLNAVEELKKKDLSIQVFLYGDCVTASDLDYKRDLEEIIEEKGLKKEVIFAGGIPYHDLSKSLSDCHITVNMTPPGGMDKVVLFCRQYSF